MDMRNQWQPVTEIYQQGSDPAAAQFDADPMTLVNAVRKARRAAEGNVPFGITAITALYFIRAAIYTLFAVKLAAAADTDLGIWIVSRCPALIPFSLSGVDHKKLPTTMAEVLGVLAALSLALGVMWLLRWKPILFISVLFSGYIITWFAICMFNIGGLGDSSVFSNTQIDLVVVEAATNLLIFFYIALYPNLKNTFRRQF